MSDDNEYKPEPVTEGEAFAIGLGIGELQRVVHENAVAHGFWEAECNMGEKIALMHAELSEALEAHRAGEPDIWYEHRGRPKGDYSSVPFNEEGERGKPQGIATEFADCIIRILDTCEHEGIPIIEALLAKHDYNTTRPYKHGKKY